MSLWQEKHRLLRLNSKQRKIENNVFLLLYEYRGILRPATSLQLSQFLRKSFIVMRTVCLLGQGKEVNKILLPCEFMKYVNQPEKKLPTLTNCIHCEWDEEHCPTGLADGLCTVKPRKRFFASSLVEAAPATAAEAACFQWPNRITSFSTPRWTLNRMTELRKFISPPRLRRFYHGRVRTSDARRTSALTVWDTRAVVADRPLSHKCLPTYICIMSSQVGSLL